MKRTILGIVLALLLVGVLVSACDIRPVKAISHIYINSDGSIDPPDAPIERSGNVYTFKSSINAEIHVVRSNIVIDGNAYTLQGSGGGTSGFWVAGSNVLIRNTIIEGFTVGVYLGSSYNTISGNQMTDIANCGVKNFPNSSYNTISGNTLTNVLLPISIIGSYNTVSENIINGCNDCVRFYGSYNVVSENTIDDCSSRGVYIDGSHNTVSENTMTSSDGVYLVPPDSNNNMVFGNTIDGGGVGVGGSYNVVSWNTITNGGIGLGSNNTASENTIFFSGYAGIQLVNYSTASGNTIMDTSGSGIAVYSHCTVDGNTIVNSSEFGIRLWGSFNTVSGNTVTKNSWGGIGFDVCSNNTIVGNNITDNYDGIFLYGSLNNKIYHNNFINNIYQVYINGKYFNSWDDGYPSGGNYWSDYIGGDVFYGPGQNLSGSDGIGDQPYVIDVNNTDRYPFKTQAVNIHGRILVKALEPARIPMPTYEIRHVEVSLERRGVYLETTFTDFNGNFEFSYAGSSSGTRIRITLRDFNLIEVYDHERDSSSPAWILTPFQADAPSEVNITMTIITDNTIYYQLNKDYFHPTRPDDTNVGEDRFAHLAVIYYNTYLAAQFAVENLGLTLDHSLPVEVYAYSTVDTNGDGTPDTFYDPTPSAIHISPDDSVYSSGERPDNREWHEFGHHVMMDSLIGGDNNLPPTHVDDENHGEYPNGCTSDSWREGFAEFFSCLVAKVMAGETEVQARLYRWDGSTKNFEDRCAAWEIEEFAVASLLWDLYDVNNEGYNIWGLNLHDHLTLSLSEIWSIFTDSTRNMNDMKDVYDALIADIGNVDYDADGIGDTDELFIVHGFFVDALPLGQYNGEEIGRAAHTAAAQYFDACRVWTTPPNPPRILRNARPARRNTPPINGSYIFISALDNMTGTPVEEIELYVEIKYDAPYEDFNYNYTNIWSNLPRMVYIVMPTMQSEAYIYARAPDYTAEPLIMNSAFYWDTIESGASYLLNHTFYLQPTHDIAVTNITTYKTVVGQNYPLRVNITIENQGLFFNETFNVTVYANTTIIGAQPVTLAAGNSTTITITCNTTDLAKSNYTITAHAIPVSGEKDLIDNNRTADSMVKIGVPGDLNNDNKCNILDLVKEAGKFGAVKGDPDPNKPKYDPNYDLNDDEKINILDLVKLAGHFGTTDP